MRLTRVDAGGWGMVTTAQAAELGVQRLDLSRLARAGHLERLAHGVYRDAGAPAAEHQSLRAAWLATDPSRSAEARLRDLTGGIVVMGESAATLHGVGDLPADRHELSSPTRRQTQRPDVSFRQRQLNPADVTIADGLPVTTIERTIADLVEARTDLNLVADVLRDAARARHVDTRRLTELLSPLAARNGLSRNDGAALLERLTAIAGLDEASLAEAIGASETLSALVAANSLARFTDAELSTTVIGPATQQALEAMSQSIARSLQESVADSLAPVLEAFAASIEMPSMPGIDAVLAEAADRISRSLPAQELLASFGERWAAALAVAPDTPRVDVQRAIDVKATAEGVGMVGTRG